MCTHAVNLVLSPMQVIFRRKKKDGGTQTTTQTNKQANTAELNDYKQTNSKVIISLVISRTILGCQKMFCTQNSRNEANFDSL